MDQGVLVRERTDGGRKLIDRLTADGLPLAAAYWARPDGDSPWCLYLASPAVDARGARAVYPQVHKALGELDGGWAHPFEVIDHGDVRLVETTDRLAAAVQDYQRRHPGPADRWDRAGLAADGTVAGWYVYGRRPAEAAAPAAGG